jgi:hypothetical protein
MRSRSVAECVESPAHAGELGGAAQLGEAAGDGRLVRIGLFPDGRARFRATTCASLIAYAEVACQAIEAGFPPARLDAEALRGLVVGVHPQHLERAALVAEAIRTALAPPEKP